MHEVIMPKLGLTMESGKVEKWLKKEGDKVEAGEILFEVMTDKVSLEVEAYHSGYLRKILAEEGVEIPVTNVIAYIGGLDEKVPDKAENIEPEYKRGKTESSIESEPDSKENISSNITNNPKPATEEQFVKISPLARNLAKELSIDYIKEKIKGTGPGERIINEDILAFKEKREFSSVGEALNTSLVSEKLASSVFETFSSVIKVKSVAPLKGIRKVISEKMTYSKQNIPHIIQTMVISAESLVELREKIKDKAVSLNGIHITYTDFIIKAAARLLAEQPVINSSLQGENHIIYDDVNVAIGIATDSGLVVATIYNANKRSIFDIAKKRTELVEKAKNSSLKLEEISNATFTISNLGMFGIRNFTAIINPPQGAILMVGEIYKSAVEENGQAVFRKFMDISLAVDHRIIDGADSARYLQGLREIIENPELLLI
ncbi:MAG: dihydrolipoamide acetyltransferase family protein [Candidatus Humimicrobiaceae bacterium]